MIAPVPEMTALLSDLQSLAAKATGREPAVPATGSGGSSSFVDTLKTAVGRVDGEIATANARAHALAAGDHDIALSDVMVSLEQANLAFQAATTIRDRVTEAYTSIMNMQV